MKPVLSKQIILNVFEGKATPLQKALVEEWLADPDHQELYFEWLEEWERENPQFLPDTEQAYGRSLYQREPLTSENKIVRSFPVHWERYQWLVASVVVLLTLGY